MISKTKKQNIIKELEERFKRQKIAILTDFRGINVSKMTILRRELKKLDAEFKVAKKTFLRIAFKTAGIDYDPKMLEGEIGVVFGYQDQIEPIKGIMSFIKKNKTFRILKGLLDGRLLSEEDVIAFSKLPPKHELIVKLAWVLNSPIQGFHNILSGNLKNLVVVLNKVKDKKNIPMQIYKSVS